MTKDMGVYEFGNVAQKLNERKLNERIYKDFFKLVCAYFRTLCQ